MADLNTSYTLFDIYDYMGNKTLSTYNLAQTPFKFIADLSLYPTKDVVWSFGDGTTSDSLTATKYYSFPGAYPVNLLVYDCKNNAIISSYSQTVEVKDFIPLTLHFDNLSSNTNGLNLTQSRFHGPWNLVTTYPFYQPILNVSYVTKNSNSLNYGEVESNKFSHLEKTHSAFRQIYNYELSAFQYYEIPEIQIDNVVDIYAKIGDEGIVITNKTDKNSFFIGSSAITPIFYKDDSVGNTTIKFKYKNNNVIINDTVDNCINLLNISLSANILPNNDAYRLSITSNGLDGEGTPINSFDIHPIKFYNTDIPFVIKIKDTQNFSLKNFDELTLNTSNLSVLSSGNYISPNYYNLSSLNQTIEGVAHAGSLRALINFNTNNAPLSNVTIVYRLTASNDNLSAFSLSGTSSKFTVIGHNYFDIYKINENFNASQTLNDLAFQERIKNNPILFNDFFGSILGSDEYDHDSIGVKTYEKISNFNINTKNIDTEDINSLISDLNFLGNSGIIFDKSLFNYPEKIKRILNLSSVKSNYLLGTENKFNQNFDIKGYTQKDLYGKNIGSQIDTNSYTISAGTPIVALEKFSNTYTLLNTFQPLCAGTGYTYKLSAYSSNWGWPLVLPSNFNPVIDFAKYYLFFDFVSGYDNTRIGGIVDFDNDKTTIDLSSLTYENLYGNRGLFDIMVLDSLYQSLSM